MHHNLCGKVSPVAMPGPTSTMEIGGDGVAVIRLQNPPVNALHPDGKASPAMHGSCDALFRALPSQSMRCDLLLA